MTEPQATLYFDGECGLCRGFVEFIRARDRRQRIELLPLQSSKFEARIPGFEQLREMDTAVLATADGKLHVRSAAAIEACSLLGGRWKFLALLMRVMPRAFRDWVYRWIARNRKKFSP